jgi:hypothetical protein
MGLQAETEKPPTIVNASVGRTWEYLTAVEVERLMAPRANRADTAIGVRPQGLLSFRLLNSHSLLLFRWVERLRQLTVSFS